MELDVNFKSVCKILKKDAGKDSLLIEAIDTLLGLTIVCAPVALGPAGLCLLPILKVKNELTKIGRRVFGAATKLREDDYYTRFERMRTAHGLLVYTAFFEALDNAISNELRKRVDLDTEDRRMLAGLGSQTSDSRDAISTANATADAQSNSMAEVSISFPHPTQSLHEQAEGHHELWKQLSEGFWRFIQMLAVWDELNENERMKLHTSINGIPKGAARMFVAQYVELSRAFPDFAIWANLHQHATTQDKVSTLDTLVRDYIALCQQSHQAVDLGFTKLYETITDLHDQFKKGDAADILDGLAKHYAARLDDLIIEDKDVPTEDGPKLRFPKVRNAFVPQLFRAARVTGRSPHLEDEKTWGDLHPREDLGPFLFSHLLSPYSTEAPLLILGHPGSGKSLLTKVLAAQLAARHHSVVRVPLREVDAEIGIVAQIEDAIGQITHRRVDSWAALSAGFRDHPPVVILDGYDELLQASGKVYAGYLRDAMAFQKSEADQGRPVRVIVTSRLTLIDKAMVPTGSTALRLLEFDAKRQQEWISVWNATNTKYFSDARIDEFRLPCVDQPGAKKILALAEQPLLLLMLALYDSQDNQLRKSIALDRTRLYDELLRQFITRERGKERAFHVDLTLEQQDEEIDKEMRRLGVAAVGMFNRRQVHILAEELEADLKFFDIFKNVTVTEGRALTQADLLLGSFFFIHKSQTKRGDASAFEFLHNTLGEFLTADFILRWAVEEVRTLVTLQNQETLKAKYYDMLNSPDGLQRQWFASLIYTPLFTRPVILEMMHEWSGHLLEACGMSREEFAEHLDMLLHNQIERLISKRAMPSIMRNETVDERFRARFGDHPLVGHIAVYSLNLILLRVIACERSFVIDENAIDSYEDVARPWDRLIHIWRSWFSLEALHGLTAVIESTRKDCVIEIKAKPTFLVPEARGRLDVLLNVSLALADDLTTAVSGLAQSEVASSQVIKPLDIAQRLSSEKIEADFQIAVRTLAQAVCATTPKVCDIKELIRCAVNAMEIAVRERPRHDAEHVALLFAVGVRTYVAARSADDPSRLSGNVYNRHIQLAMEPITNMVFISQLIDKSPEAALTWLKASKQLHYKTWMFEELETRKLAELIFRNNFHAIKRFRNSPTTLLACIEVLQELGLSLWGKRWVPRELPEKIFPRIIKELTNLSPEATLSLLVSIHKIGGYTEQFWRHMKPKVMLPLLEPRYLLMLAERSPEAAFKLLRSLEGNSRQLWRHLGKQVAEQLFHPRFLLELSERCPESALILADIGAMMMSDDQLKSQLEQLWNSSQVDSILVSWLSRSLRDPRGFAAALFFARHRNIFPDTRRKLADAVACALTDESLALVLPLAVSEDLQWLTNRWEAPYNISDI